MYRPEHFVKALLKLHPDLRPRDGDFVIDNAGNGPFIAYWNREDIKQPTKAEIESIDTDLIVDPDKTVTPQQARLALKELGLTPAQITKFETNASKL